MVSDNVSVALSLVQLIALTLPVLAIMMQAILSFQSERSKAEWQFANRGILQWFAERRIGLLFYSFLGLYAALAAAIYYIFHQMELPFLLDLSIAGILVGFGILLVTLASFSRAFDNYVQIMEPTDRK